MLIDLKGRDGTPGSWSNKGQFKTSRSFLSRNGMEHVYSMLYCTSKYSPAGVRDVGHLNQELSYYKDIKKVLMKLFDSVKTSP